MKVGSGLGVSVTVATTTAVHSSSRTYATRGSTRTEMAFSMQESVVMEVQGQAGAAADLISDGGYLGAPATANRILSFARQLAGGDPSKWEQIKKGIEQGFRDAMRLLAGLPEVSQRTWDLVQKGLVRETGQSATPSGSILDVTL